MEKTQLYLNVISLIIIVTTVTIAVFSFLILLAIKKYNKTAFAVQLEYENYKIKHERLLLETEIEIQEQTFQLISKEIHDNISQSLSLANVTLNCINTYGQTEIDKEISKSKEQLSKALNDLNNLSKSLDLDLIQSHGLVAAVNFEIERWNRLFDNNISLDTNGEIRHLDNTKELFVFRILQESINNAIKYANSKNIEIYLGYSEKDLTLKVEDNGKGFNLNEFETNKIIGKKSGIKNMRQRAELLGGDFSLSTSPGIGTKIEILIPFTNAK